MEINDCLFLLTVVFGLAYYFVQRRYSYWERLKVPFIKPRFPFGNISALGRTVHLSKLFQTHYHKLKGSGQFGGIYSFMTPTVLATNLDFIKNVLIKDFNYFASRGIYYNEIDDPLSGHLFSIDGDKWRTLRSKLTPTFTSGRMKFMFPTILSVADELIATIDISTQKHSELELKEILARFTTDVIGTCAFGIDCNSLKNPNSEFRKFGQKHFEKPRNSLLKIFVLNSFPQLGRKLKMKMIADDVSEFFLNSLRETIHYREENNIQRNDFLNMMIQLHKYGRLDGYSEGDSTNDKLSFFEVASQSFVFFLAGFETSSTTMLFCLFELSVNLEIQNKARQEVSDVLTKYDGKFTYEGIMEIHYLDCCIQEALRKYPPLSFLMRECVKDYLVPNIGITIAKGTPVQIPIYGIHHDPDIYQKPDLFDPHRFTPTEKQKRHPLSFLPFGHGQRNCIGLRFGLMQTKVGLSTILKHFEFSPCSKSTNPLVLNPKSLILTPNDGMWLNIKKISV